MGIVSAGGPRVVPHGRGLAVKQGAERARAGPGGAGAPERARWARMACTTRGSWTVAMTRSRASQRGQARTSRASTRRIKAAQVQAFGVPAARCAPAILLARATLS
ncbi:MAG: hypothetical protein A2X52_03930 [Candidatus Rokubacteria bacterium GWC2_70_16]|nr:MAG: hypothetical protein A2X52_03930 [Candidatus Rokubacteria bacterium GWC2_70_16]